MRAGCCQRVLWSAQHDQGQKCTAPCSGSNISAEIICWSSREWLVTEPCLSQSEGMAALLVFLIVFLCCLIVFLGCGVWGGIEGCGDRKMKVQF